MTERFHAHLCVSDSARALSVCGGGGGAKGECPLLSAISTARMWQSLLECVFHTKIGFACVLYWLEITSNPSLGMLWEKPFSLVFPLEQIVPCLAGSVPAAQGICPPSCASRVRSDLCWRVVLWSGCWIFTNSISYYGTCCLWCLLFLSLPAYTTYYLWNFFLVILITDYTYYFCVRLCGRKTQHHEFDSLLVITMPSAF